ncbi:hypothetical protein [Rhodococcus sp. 114MFTsu3.1]|uniref:hypothetical protein n=1 Tax=Rhodococcus sp. 114MFTsu3.1 TaxID=1172184 RepID=UPI000370BA1C|nr:hypothetical protein [Rhodococcus sp. 114MFTsu3.1]
MTIVADAPTSAEVIARLGYNGMELTLLAEAIRGPFTARIQRHDAKDGDDPYSDVPQIEIDCSEQDGGQCFCDLTVLPQHVDDFLHVAVEIWSDYTALTDNIETEHQDGAFEGEFHRSSGTVGTPSMILSSDNKEVYASTFWQEDSAGRITQPYLSMNCGADVGFLPREALAFSFQLIREASHAVAVETKSQVVS